MKTKQTLEFLNAWEIKHKTGYDETQLSQVIKLARLRNGLSAESWIELTKGKGIFTRTGEKAATYAHKDIAIRFTAWLSPEFELFLVDKIQELSILEKQKSESALLNHDEIIELIKLKEVFKYVAHQVSLSADRTFAARKKKRQTKLRLKDC